MMMMIMMGLPTAPKKHASTHPPPPRRRAGWCQWGKKGSTVRAGGTNPIFIPANRIAADTSSHKRDSFTPGEYKVGQGETAAAAAAATCYNAL